MILLIQTSLVAYTKDETDSDVPLELRPRWDALRDEVGILLDIEDTFVYNHIPISMVENSPRYQRWKDVVYRDAVEISKDSRLRDKVRKLVARTYGLKDIELPE